MASVWGQASPYAAVGPSALTVAVSTGPAEGHPHSSGSPDDHMSNMYTPIPTGYKIWVSVKAELRAGLRTG